MNNQVKEEKGLKRALAIVAAILMFAQMLTGCLIIKESPDQNQTGTASAEAFEPKSLGSAAFTVDESKTSSIDYNGTDTSVGVADGNGLFWTLDIPNDALVQPQTITMTAMSGVSVDTLGTMAGGVILEPDGLTFLEPVKLTVTGNGINDHSLLFTGNHDGTNLAFTCMEDSAGGVSAEIFHFSTAMLYDWDGDEQIKNMETLADEHLADAMKRAKEMLKSPVEDPPIPPDISLKCKKGTHDPDINQYFNAFSANFKEPEMSLITELISAERLKQYMGTSENDDALNMAVRLLERLRTKAGRLIEKYRSEPDKFYASSAAYLEVERMIRLAGGKDNTDWEPLREWCESVAGKHLSDLTDKHDYTSIHALVRAARILELIGGDADAYLTKLDSAMKFDLKIELQMRTMAEYYFKYEIIAEIPIQLTPDLEGRLAVGQGTGKFSYTLAESPIGEFKSPNSYPCEVFITDFDPCTSDVVKLSLDTIGAQAETWYYTLSGLTVTDDTTSHWLAGMLFAGGNSALYNFSMSLKNMDAKAVDETIDKKASDEGLLLEGSIHVTLEHKPNG